MCGLTQTTHASLALGLGRFARCWQPALVANERTWCACGRAPLAAGHISCLASLPQALDLGGRLASHPNQQALRASKALMHTRERAALEAILDEENETILKALMSDDFRRTLKVARARSKTGGGKGGARGERAKL